MIVEDKLVTVASFANYIEAEMAKQKLEYAGIKAVVTGANAATMYPIGAAIDVDLQVFGAAARRAREILESEGRQEQ